MTTAQLFSGGLDSLALWHLTGRPTPVYVCVGAPYEDAELHVLNKLCRHVPGFDPVVVPGPPIAERPAGDGHVLHRNLVLLTIAASVTGADRLLLGAVRGEASADKSRRFLRAAARALTASERRPVAVEAPAHRWTKVELLRRFAAAHPDALHQLAYTRSCYAPAGECGACQACFRRHVALYRAGLSDRRPTLPPGVSTGGALAGLRTAGVTGWPGVLANNLQAALALAGRPGTPPPTHLELTA